MNQLNVFTFQTLFKMLYLNRGSIGTVYFHKAGIRCAYTSPSLDSTCRIALGILLLVVSRSTCAHLANFSSRAICCLSTTQVASNSIVGRIEFLAPLVEIESQPTSLMFCFVFVN